MVAVLPDGPVGCIVPLQMSSAFTFVFTYFGPEARVEATR